MVLRVLFYIMNYWVATASLICTRNAAWLVAQDLDPLSETFVKRVCQTKWQQGGCPTATSPIKPPLITSNNHWFRLSLKPASYGPPQPCSNSLKPRQRFAALMVQCGNQLPDHLLESKSNHRHGKQAVQENTSNHQARSPVGDFNSEILGPARLIALVEVGSGLPGELAQDW